MPTTQQLDWWTLTDHEVFGGLLLAVIIGAITVACPFVWRKLVNQRQQHHPAPPPPPNPAPSNPHPIRMEGAPYFVVDKTNETVTIFRHRFQLKAKVTLAAIREAVNSEIYVRAKTWHESFMVTLVVFGLTALFAVLSIFTTLMEMRSSPQTQFEISISLFVSGILASILLMPLALFWQLASLYQHRLRELARTLRII